MITVKVTMGNMADELRRGKRAALSALKKRVMSDMEPVMPRRTGAFIAATKRDNRSAPRTEIVAATSRPYTGKLWEGVHSDGTPLHWTNPDTQPHWLEYTAQVHGEEWRDLVKEEIIKSVNK